jgi:23S rRNA pseudouridine1911/1915/1917 synthase
VTPLRLEVGREAAGLRLDRWLAAHVETLSRARLQGLIEQGRVRVNHEVFRAAHRLRGGEMVEVEIPALLADDLRPEPIALTVRYEDDHVLVVDKPSGMVVHPGAGHTTGTLAAAVLAHAPDVAGVGGPRRPGVVHRLDKDTSGLLVVARTQRAYDSLTAQLAARTVSRRYLALVHGRMAASHGVVDAPIGRHPTERIRMAVRPEGKGRRAVTRYRVLERFAAFTYLEAQLETGRTHQIRVHFLSLGHPIYGDETYRLRSAKRLPIPFDGIALHAFSLEFMHPVTGKQMVFTSPTPPRIERLVSYLREGHDVC